MHDRTSTSTDRNQFTTTQFLLPIAATTYSISPFA